MKAKPWIITIAVAVFLVLSAFSGKKLKPVSVYMIGDSTMSQKEDTANSPERGWGMLLPEMFCDRVMVVNRAVNGRSTKNFIDEGRWDSILNKLKKGDYVIIQFGHNDRKETDSTRYVNAYSGYRRNLEKFITDTKGKGAYPIVCSSIVRRNFNESGSLIDTHGPYPFVARIVAEENHVPFLDLQQKTEDWVIRLGPTRSKEYYMNLEPGVYPKFPDGLNDNTHLVEKGARTVALFAAEELLRLKVPLSDYLRPEVISMCRKN
jgi:lysophospholipase L1-like esterase